MADSGHNGKTPLQNTFHEAAGFGLGELASEGVWMGSALIMGLIPKSVMNPITNVLGKCIEPFLNPIEKGLGAICKLEECQPDLTKSTKERAQNLARMLLVYTPGIYASWKTKFWVRRKMNDVLGVPQAEAISAPEGSSSFGKVMHKVLLRDLTAEEKMLFLADEGMHLGSLFVLNRPLAHKTDDLIKSTSQMLQKVLPISKERAHELGAAAWVWAVPNGIGALGGMLSIAGKHFGGWPGGAFGRFLGKNSNGHAQ